jgi:hypothetical protein
MTLDAMEFLRRFLEHVLPPGLPKVRHYGCHRALQNQPLVGASKPATILTGFGHVG